MKIESYDNVIKWSYKLAKTWVQENLVPKGVNSSRKFDHYKKKGEYLPRNFPRKPDEYFKKKNVWPGWPDFFGKTAENSDKSYLNFGDASRLCQQKGLRNSIEYRTWTNRPVNLPARPDQFYREEWKGWKEFLGNNYDIPEKKIVSKLSAADVRIIKHQLDMGIPGAVLARTFGVSEMQISRIKHGENWTKV
ncbi:MAG: hypothetical protein JW801_16095 [Bacteroidales bacterium]|nr:hypothetical protein [Bacteroidales bacterium]